MEYPLRSVSSLTLSTAACLLLLSCALPASGVEPTVELTLDASGDARAAALGEATLPELCEQYAADRGSLERLYRYPFSARRDARMHALNATWTARLAAVDFEGLARRDQLDWLLLSGEVAHDLESLSDLAAREAEVAFLVPFAGPLVALLEERSARELPEPRAAAEILFAASQGLDAVKSDWKTAHDEESAPTLSASAARRCASSVRSLRNALSGWYGFGAGYDPLFTWWCQAPWEALEKDLRGFEKFLEETVGGIDTDDEDLLLGDPIGREALLAELRYERIAYTPEELIALAETEFAWCDARRVEAANAMGLDGDWRAAQEQVRGEHVEPGEQPALIRDIAAESVAFLTERGLLRIPPLAEESWRLGMMSPERQKFSPYFTGGEVISISYPTDSMDQDAKLQSMRGNNRHFSRATVHHELIPGHHLQGYMSDRWATHRGMFRTPFLVEGWALYWELRLWDLDFATGPEDELGMLFWRAHRAARILFSLNFQLGNWSPEECVDFLVERVGHDRNNAEAEVRRSIQGGYGPLYQAAYLLGGMQLYALHDELVEDGDWSEPDFHEAVLRQNSIPPDLIRALLSGQELTRDLPITWRFPGAGR